MNEIKTHALNELGYRFVEEQFLPPHKDEYYLRNIQNKWNKAYRKLHTSELDTLIHNRNTSDNWDKILVTDDFNPALVKNCKFYGLVRIGAMQPVYREFHNFKMAVGLYNSAVISCDIGDNVCIDNVNYLSHYIVCNDVMIVNVNEMATTDYSKFGNGILKEGEDEKLRTWIEVCNENGGRSILPFNGMLPGDAYMWSRYRDDKILMKKLIDFTQEEFDTKRGYYGMIGERTVIKNSGIIKDAWIGTDAYIKGANKIKNVTINSDAKRKTQIGEGCELVNGIVGFGCRIFYGVKAVRFVLASHSQLKYGARLINSYLGNNSTISCCEVLNSLIFPSHEQHHNNSFLCAALVMGQSNIAAGATIGSNHNSRSADGEIQAGRGFWPGLCVSLKHNSKFASYTLISKGDFPAELNIPIPFSLVSHDISNDRIVVMPAYWFMYNMYALERNAAKYVERDRRTEKTQLIAYRYLAPDTINEIFDALTLLKSLVPETDGSAEISGWENSKRKTLITKIPESIAVFRELIVYYAANTLLEHFAEQNFDSFDTFKKSIPVKIARSTWINFGGQLMRASAVKSLKDEIRSGDVSDWKQVHERYREEGRAYSNDKLEHAFASLCEIEVITVKQFSKEYFAGLLEKALVTKEWMLKGISTSRKKDYTNPFRKMIYETNDEMNNVLGRFEDNNFISAELANFETLKSTVSAIRKTIQHD